MSSVQESKKWLVRRPLQVVDPRFRARGSAAGPDGQGIIRRLHCEQQEVATDLHLSHFVFSIPASATPTFRTPMVSLRCALGCWKHPDYAFRPRSLSAQQVEKHAALCLFAGGFCDLS